MPRGGKRKGAGRPKGSKEKGTVEKEIAREWVRQKVIAGMVPMIEAQMAAATGIKYLVARQKKGGKFVEVTEELSKAILNGQDKEHEFLEVWEKQPSTPAFTDLMNRALDKPKEQEQEIKLTGTLDIEARLKSGRERLAKAE